MATKSKKTVETKKPAAPAKKTAEKKLVETKTRELAGRLATLNDMLVKQREMILQGLQQGNESGIDNQSHGDLVDQSNSFSDREIMLGLAEHDRKQLAAINEALELIQKGTYGTCARCKNEIPDARLAAVPTAKYCVKCQSQMETGGR